MGRPLLKAYADRATYALVRGDKSTRRRLLLPLYLVLSTVFLGLLVYLSRFATRMYNPTTGVPEPVNVLSCDSDLWGGQYEGWGCDSNGQNCLPFETDAWYPVRCPPRCGWKNTTRHIWGGGRSRDAVRLPGRPSELRSGELSVGVASAPYTANSKLCMAAVHSGVVGQNGGCMRLRLTGASNYFMGSDAHGVASLTFPSWFPKGVIFEPADATLCTDFWFAILPIVLLLLFLLPLFAPSRGVYWCALVTCAYW